MKHYLSSLTSRRFFTVVSTRNNWQPVIGLEIHAQVKANSKLFSPSGTEFGGPPNSQVSFFDASLPGTLPVLNKKCVEEAVKTALAFNSKINKYSTFDRKHYFYSDLPAGYQITQQRNPIATGGHLKYLYKSTDRSGKQRWVEKQADLIQIQLEQDSGKSLHNTQNGISLIDLNRAGVGLMEIITHPIFASSEEAVAFVKELQLVLQTIDSCDAKMEEGGLRVDASVSVHESNEPLGTRTEIKNLNSLRSLGKAIDFEIERQINELENGREITNDTLSFNIETGQTVVMRDKEKLHDYRFMSEPNLPPLILHSNEPDDTEVSKDSLFFNVDNLEMGKISDQVVNIDLISEGLPELPNQRRQRLISKFDLTIDQAFILVGMPELVAFFERCVSVSDVKARAVANFFINEILSVLNEENLEFNQCGITQSHVLSILNLLDNKKVALSTAKEVLKVLFKNPQLTADEVVLDRGWSLVSDDEVLRAACVGVVRNNPDAIKLLQAGKKKTLNYLIGQVQKEMKGQADGKKIADIFNELIK